MILDSNDALLDDLTPGFNPSNPQESIAHDLTTITVAPSPVLSLSLSVSSALVDGQPGYADASKTIRILPNYNGIQFRSPINPTAGNNLAGTVFLYNSGIFYADSTLNPLLSSSAFPGGPFYGLDQFAGINGESVLLKTFQQLPPGNYVAQLGSSDAEPNLSLNIIPNLSGSIFVGSMLISHFSSANGFSASTGANKYLNNYAFSIPAGIVDRQPIITGMMDIGNTAGFGFLSSFGMQIISYTPF